MSTAPPPWAPYASSGPDPSIGQIPGGGGAFDSRLVPTPGAGLDSLTGWGDSADARSWGFAQGLWNGTVANGPAFALNANQRDQYANQIAYQNAMYGNQSDYLTSSNANQLAQLGLKSQGIGIDQAANARQVPYLNTLHDLASQLFDLSGQRIDLKGIEAWQQAGQQQRQAKSSAVASGSNTSIGFNDTLGDIANQLTNAGTELNIQKGELGVNRQQETTQWQEKLAQNTDAGKQLDLQAQSLGVDRNQLALDLQSGLDKLGISRFASVADLYDKMSSSSIQDQIIAQQILAEALKNSDAYAQQYPGPSGPSGSVNAAPAPPWDPGSNRGANRVV